jgi:hypothetical protein
MATANTHNLPQDYLKKLFFYDSVEGHLIWSINRAMGKRTKGKRFGFEEPGGRRKGMIDSKNYREANLIWMYHYGDIPKGIHVDHIDRNPSNNRLNNLRLATPKQNSGNREKQYNSSNDYKGVYQSGKSSWRMMCAGKYYGVYKTEVEAALKYNEVALERWGEFANINIIK